MTVRGSRRTARQMPWREEAPEAAKGERQRRGVGDTPLKTTPCRCTPHAIHRARLQASLDRRDGQAIGHRLGLVGDLVDPVNEVAKVVLVREVELVGTEDPGLEAKAQRIGLVLVEVGLVKVVLDRPQVLEKGPRRQYDRLRRPARDCGENL